MILAMLQNFMTQHNSAMNQMIAPDLGGNSNALVLGDLRGTPHEVSLYTGVLAALFSVGLDVCLVKISFFLKTVSIPFLHPARISTANHSKTKIAKNDGLPPHMINTPLKNRHNFKKNISCFIISCVSTDA